MMLKTNLPSIWTEKSCKNLKKKKKRKKRKEKSLSKDAECYKDAKRGEAFTQTFNEILVGTSQLKLPIQALGK